MQQSIEHVWLKMLTHFHTALRKAKVQQLLFDNTARNIAGVSEHIVKKHIEHCTKADPAYGKGVADAIAKQKAGKL